MPIERIGFRGWDGERSSAALRWWVIAQTGIRLVWKSSWVRRMLFFAWTPTFAWAALIFSYERFVGPSPESVQFVVPLLEWVDSSTGEFATLIGEMQSDPEAARHGLWAAALMIYFRWPQAILMVMLVGLIAPPLISRDVRSRAFLVYFSRPLRPSEYVVGKASVVCTYLLMISGLPALALYILAILLSPDVSMVGQTWDLPLRIFLATLVLLIPTTATALCFSSMTSESRYAGFAWFSVWILGHASYSIMSMFSADFSYLSDNGVVNRSVSTNSWTLLSPYMILGEIQKWIFGFKGSFQEVLTETVIVVVVTVVAVTVLMRRVSAPMRV